MRSRSRFEANVRSAAAYRFWAVVSFWTNRGLLWQIGYAEFGAAMKRQRGYIEAVEFDVPLSGRSNQQACRARSRLVRALSTMPYTRAMRELTASATADERTSNFCSS